MKSERLQQLADKLQELGCPLIHASQQPQLIQQWIKELPASEDRVKFLEWICSTLIGSSMPLEPSLVTLGIFSKQQQASDFVTGKSGKKANAIWNSIYSLVLAHSLSERSIDKVSLDFNRCDDFTDATAETVSFSEQMRAAAPILDYQMEKELSHHGKGPSYSSSVIQSILEKVETEKENLKSSQENQSTEEEVEIVLRERLDRFLEESSRLTETTEDFGGHFNSKLKPVLKNKSRFIPANSDEVKAVKETTALLREYMDGSQATFNSINSINNFSSNNINSSIDLSRISHLS